MTDINKIIHQLRASKLVHHQWYHQTYPDVAEVDMKSTEHYYRFGAGMGRNPCRHFDTEFYVNTYLDGDLEGENPILHYLQNRTEIDTIRPYDADHSDVVRLGQLSHKLLTLGFTEPAIADIEKIAMSSVSALARSLARCELALWYMMARTPNELRLALSEIAIGKVDAESPELRATYTAMAMMCHYLLGEDETCARIYDDAALRGEINPNAMLVRSNVARTDDERLAMLNALLDSFDIAPLGLLPQDPAGKQLPIYDRLTTAESLASITEGPLVTVLIAAYNAEDTIECALRSLREQTWRNLQIIVLDDCSSDKTCEVVKKCAKLDPRVTLVPLEENGGAYVARNRGLDMAVGKYVTLNDADDWSHPQKIETQVRFMEEHPQVVGSTTQQARATNDMMFNRWSGALRCLKANVSSLMFRRSEMRETMGYYDTVRFGADSELINRMRSCYGRDAVVHIESGPLSFQRDTDGSAVADLYNGMQGFFFGSRKEYLDAQSEYRGRTKDYKYDGIAANRKFAIPFKMRPDRNKFPEKRHFDVIIASEYRMKGGSRNSCLEEIKASIAAGLKVGVVWMFRYDLEGVKRALSQSAIRPLIDGEQVQVLNFGEDVTCDLLIVRYPPVLQYVQRYLPNIEAGDIRVIVNQPPVSDYSEEGVLRYRIPECAKNIRTMFGKDATWHPIGPNVRDALHEHHENDLSSITLAEEDWVNIIDIDEWSRGDYVPDLKARPMRIGRHSRNNPMKWPATRDDLMAAYPDKGDVEVHVLGGVSTLTHLLPKIPTNWKVHEFGEIEPKDFLPVLDVFIYFHNPDWVESFGRTIFEAMAAGVPAILSHDYEQVFGDAALYCNPQEAINLARQLCESPELYQAQVEKAREFVAKRYGYGLHTERLNEIKAETARRNAVVEAKALTSTRDVQSQPPQPAVSSVVEGKSKVAAAELGIGASENPSCAQAPAKALEKSKPASKTAVKPKPIARKVSLDKLKDIRQLDWPLEQLPFDERAALRVDRNGLRYDMLWSPSDKEEDRQRLFILLSGRVYRDKMQIPVFQRWSWARKFPGNCLYISDPSLWQDDDLGLAWYAGNTETDAIEGMSEIVGEIAEALGIDNTGIIAYGSSGGGFAAMRLATKMPEIGVVTINPQVDVYNFYPKQVRKFLDVCFAGFDAEEVRELFEDRVCLLPSVSRLLEHRMIYIQNRLDDTHFDQHYGAFCEAVGTDQSENEKYGKLRKLLFDDPAGHGAGENAEVFNKAMQIVAKDRSWK